MERVMPLLLVVWISTWRSLCSPPEPHTLLCTFHIALLYWPLTPLSLAALLAFLSHIDRRKTGPPGSPYFGQHSRSSTRMVHHGICFWLSSLVSKGRRCAMSHVKG